MPGERVVELAGGFAGVDDPLLPELAAMAPAAAAAPTIAKITISFGEIPEDSRMTFV